MKYHAGNKNDTVQIYLLTCKDATNILMSKKKKKNQVTDQPDTTF